jgi:hypothetical protein
VNCSICKKPIELVPSALERAKKYGNTAAYYTRLFTEHAACILKKRTEDTAKLIGAKLNA